MLLVNCCCWADWQFVLVQPTNAPDSSVQAPLTHRCCVAAVLSFLAPVVPHLPAPSLLFRRALSIAAISCKLTLCVVVFAVCAAAFSTNSPHLLPTLQTVVNVVLLRAGFAVGLLWRMLPVLLPLAKQAVGV